jgi:hypothetical protein
MLEKYEGILQMMEPDEAANWAGLLLLLLGSRLRLLNCWRGRIPLLRFLLFSDPPPALCHVENEGALPFKGDFARKL